MSIRIGMGLFGWPFTRPEPQALWDYVDETERLGLDSIWLTDRIVSPEFSMDPMVALSFIAARTKKLKFGTSVLALPLRNPTVLAKEIATLDFLANGRALPAIGLGTEDEREYEACGVPKSERGSRTDEMMEVMRRLWLEDEVTHHGKHYTLNRVSVQPKPVQKPVPLWIGGRSEAALRRTGRIGDGWLVSQATPEEVRSGIERIKAIADEHGNNIEDDHYGVLFNYCIADTREKAQRLAADYMPFRRTDIAPEALAALGAQDIINARIQEYVDAGATKFVLRSACPPDMLMEQLRLLGESVVPAFH
ncbi:MAG: LLM class flavin-dependent oxidoreductase [Chloroflexi bacterium]|nr:LLM class flavin-dependent oxidoreductase [Chloroflexota bacterium]